MLCWIGALLLLIKITESKKITRKRAKDICWFGVVAGIGMLCKVHTVFLWFGFGLYILIYSREWLKHWSVYAAAAITAVFFLPVIAWNIQNDFITFFFHGKRVDVASGGLNIESFFTFTGGQVFYCNPLVFFIIAIAIWHRDLFVKPAQKRILLLVGLPLIAIASLVSLFKDLLPHWTGPGYASLILLSACYFAGLKRGAATRKVPRSFKIANALLLIVIIAGIGVINFYPGTIGHQKAAQRGENDFTLDMYGWRQFSKSFDSIYQSTHQVNPAGKTVILANKWFPAAHIDFYLGMPLGIQTLALGPVEDIHQYHWLNRQRGYITDSTDIYVISPSNYQVPVSHFSALRQVSPAKVDTIVQYRGGKEARRFTVAYYKKGLYRFYDGADY
jgi:Dolichyl-phosphate-mannose-protein mannosyltransferase